MDYTGEDALYSRCFISMISEELVVIDHTFLLSMLDAGELVGVAVKSSLRAKLKILRKRA